MMFENIMFKYFGIKNLVPFLLIMSIKWIGKIKLEYNDEKSVEIYEKRHLIKVYNYETMFFLNISYPLLLN